ncbi:hypothetical protein EPR50_G00132670 [Perca flavescens]|uniref:Uncharacterized protein n=1 Tax=Perca flavescens TaxID=8167 RepID=A0A484CUK9_PERFV|nr:hypothetical protein EPR50_G00132670 [Perca flavescens]
METDSVALGDVESLHGGLSLLDPLVDRILVDTVSQQQGWLRVYGKRHTHTGRKEVGVGADSRHVSYPLRSLLGVLAGRLVWRKSQVTLTTAGQG